ncbi:MAG: type II toxin-antitoxin system PemK/MazF family toxin [Bacteroidales bacterium]|nr:type II toxin-antitoxin system PemK/MazF family toxin [Bacteroidales bacterium]
MFWRDISSEISFFWRGKVKKRPVLIILDTGDNDIVVCRITSKIYSTEFDFKIEDWKGSGLKLPSVVRLHKIATLEKDLIYKKLGQINEELKKEIKKKFKNIIE